jgi:hypothetical protein
MAAVSAQKGPAAERWGLLLRDGVYGCRDGGPGCHGLASHNGQRRGSSEQSGPLPMVH